LTGHNASIYCLDNGAIDTKILSAAGEGWVVEWDLTNPKDGKLLVNVDKNIYSLLHLPRQQLIIAGDMDGGVHWADLANPDLTKNIAHHQKGVFDIQSINGQVYTLGGAGLLTKWDIEKRRTVESFQLTNFSLRTIAHADSRGEIAIGASDHNIYILNESDWEIKQIIRKAHSNSVFSLCYSPDQKYLLSGGRDAHLRVWDMEAEAKMVSEQAAHWFTINDIVYHPEGYLFATASRDKTIKIWDAENWKLLKVIDTARFGGHVNSVNRLYWTRYNNYLVSCSDDRSLIVWELEPIPSF